MKLGQPQENIFMSSLTMTYCCEVVKTYVDILEDEIKNYQMKKKINKMKDGFIWNGTFNINKVSMGI